MAEITASMVKDIHHGGIGTFTQIFHHACGNYRKHGERSA